LTGIKAYRRVEAEFLTVILIGGATIDTLLAMAWQAMMSLKMPRGVEVA